MKVDVLSRGKGFVYRLRPDPDDRVEARRDFSDAPAPFRLVGREYRVVLPETFRSIHPDAHALAVWHVLRPLIGSRLALPFAVSRELSDWMESRHGMRFARVSRRQEPRRAPAAVVPALLFSGGMDSMAASLVMPRGTHHLFFDRIPDTRRDHGRDALIDLAPQRKACAAVRKSGAPVHATADDHEALFEPYPMWHSNMPLLSPLYMADSLGLGAIDQGEILDASLFDGYHDGRVTRWRMKRPRRGAADDRPKDPSDFLGAAALRRVVCIGGLSEVATTAIVARSRYRGKSFSCYYRSEESFCMRCDKCFKKLLLRHIAEGRPVPEELFAHFLSIPRLAAIFSRPFFDWHHVWYYLFQRIRCRHPFARELHRQAREGPDLSLLEKWYPPAERQMEPSYADVVRENIARRVATMSAAEVRRLETLDVPPLHAPEAPGVPSRSAGAAARARASAPNARLPAFCRPSPETSHDHYAVNTTTRCQQRCVYCFEGDRSDNRHLSGEEVRALLREAAASTRTIIFMGAETTLRPDFISLVAYAKGLGLRVCVSTNGLRFSDPGFLRAAADAGLDGIELSFSYPDASVYSSVTRAAPSGFARLLQALDNIAALRSSFDSKLEIITVVSRYNHRRLREVMTLLEAHLKPLRFITVLRRVGAPKGGANPYAVPLAELREVLPPLLRDWPFPFPVALRNFPLCAAPGFEHLEADLAYLRTSTKVRQNFFGQDAFVEMYPDATIFQGHARTDLCAECSLRLCCLHRGLFLDIPDDPRNTPVPSARPAREVLLANGTPPKEVDSALAALQERSESARPASAQGPRVSPLLEKGLPGLLKRVDREASGEVRYRSRLEGDVVRVRCGGREFGLFLAPRESHTGPSFAETPSFSICIRSEAALSDLDAQRLRAYVSVLAGKDAELRTVYR